MIHGVSAVLLTSDGADLIEDGRLVLIESSGYTSEQLRDLPDVREATDEEWWAYHEYYTGGPGDPDPPNIMSPENVRRWLG